MSFFGWQGISESLLHSHERDYSNDNKGNSKGKKDNDENNENNSTETEDSTDHEFEDDIATLRCYLLITTDMDGNTFEMHRLVQLSIRR